LRHSIAGNPNGWNRRKPEASDVAAELPLSAETGH